MFSIGNDNGGAFASKVFNITNAGNVLINTTADSGYKLKLQGSANIIGSLDIAQSGATETIRLSGNGNSQGASHNYRIVKHYPVVSLGKKLIIPFISQGNLNGSTMVRIWGLAMMWNTRNPRAFSADFAVGSLNVLSDLAVLNSTGNISSISIAGMNIEIEFTSAYTSADANGIQVTLEYMTNVPSYSINVGSIAMN